MIEISDLLFLLVFAVKNGLKKLKMKDIKDGLVNINTIKT